MRVVSKRESGDLGLSGSGKQTVSRHLQGTMEVTPGCFCSKQEEISPKWICRRHAKGLEFKKQLEQSFPCRRHGESIYTPVIGNRGTCQDSMWISSPTTYSPTTSATHNLCREAKAL
nr:uncharacterized protein LOC117450046 isoform X2 [Pseudochaenichthys georgianus]